MCSPRDTLQVGIATTHGPYQQLQTYGRLASLSYLQKKQHVISESSQSLACGIAMQVNRPGRSCKIFALVLGEVRLVGGVEQDCEIWRQCPGMLVKINMSIDKNKLVPSSPSMCTQHAFGFFVTTAVAATTTITLTITTTTTTNRGTRG
jgi:hypothetical protein